MLMHIAIGAAIWLTLSIAASLLFGAICRAGEMPESRNASEEKAASELRRDELRGAEALHSLSIVSEA